MGTVSGMALALVLIALLLFFPALFVDGLNWILVVALVLIVVAVIQGRRV